MNDLKIFSGPANPALTQDICRYLNLPMGKISLGRFPDGEISCKIDEDVRGRDIFIVQPTCPPVNEHIMELLVMIDSFKRASSFRITAVIPYFGYARQDRKDAGRVPITAKLVANLIVRSGADRVLAMDLHAAQIQGFFDVPVDNHLQSLEIPKDDIVVVSADEGGIKRALGHANRIGAPLGIIDKRRLSADTTKSTNIIGASVEGKTAILFDDMISTAGSICGAAEVLHNHGAKSIYAAATHGLLVGPAIERLRQAPFNKIIITDSIPLTPGKMLPNITVLSVASLLGQAIKRIHRNESVSMMFQ
jgi:ribose-phosphate pyrophosphokinase